MRIDIAKSWMQILCQNLLFSSWASIASLGMLYKITSKIVLASCFKIDLGLLYSFSGRALSDDLSSDMDILFRVLLFCYDRRPSLPPNYLPHNISFPFF